ncbi:MAG: hypothetical protein K2K60_01975 [Clostridia bacterium]|nr:hypothetical protein [Clostridia bacterium]
MKDIIDLEEKYKKLLTDKLKGDKRLSVTCPEFKYPEPVYVYIKSVKTEKTIAVRLDGGDKTLRFWDYVDDDYSEVDGVWDEMTEAGLEKFVKKLYKVMDNAVDIEYFSADGECEDYFSAAVAFPLTAENAQKAVKKFGAGVKFIYAKFSNFYGDIQFVFDRTLKQIKLK